MPKLKKSCPARFNSFPPRSPLRYPGGKFRALETIVPLILSQNAPRLVSPFIGGGSVEIAVADSGMEVLGFDSFAPLTNFWKFVLEDPTRLADRVSFLYPLSKSRFYQLQHRFEEVNGIEQAAWFYALNRASRNGLTLSGGFSGERFEESSIVKLRKFRCPLVSVQACDFKDTLASFQSDLLYIDPPYFGCPNLYGKRGSHSNEFPHRELAKILRYRSKFILSYNDRREVRELYSGCRFLFPSWHWGMKNGERGEEVLIVSDDIRLDHDDSLNLSDRAGYRWEIDSRAVEPRVGWSL